VNSPLNMKLCLVGFGEVTQTWIDSLLASGYPRDALCVLYFPHGGKGTAEVERRAAERDVRLFLDPGHIPTRIDLFVNATNSGAIEGVFQACLPHLSAGQIWADLVSAAPAIKAACAEQAAEAGVPYVDIAMMSAAWIHGHRTPLWICGSGESAFAAWAQAQSTPIRSLGAQAGTAAKVKMCRSIILKGMAAVLIEGLIVAEKNGIADLALQCIREDLGETITDTVCTRFIAGSLLHGERRAVELRGAIDLAQRSGWQERTINSTADMLHFIATSGGREVVTRSTTPMELIAAFIGGLPEREDTPESSP